MRNPQWHTPPPSDCLKYLMSVKLFGFGISMGGDRPARSVQSIRHFHNCLCIGDKRRKAEQTLVIRFINESK